MNRTLLILLAVLILAASAAANPACLGGDTLQNYINNYNNLGNACLIGDKLFYDFTYTPTASGGASPVSASLIHVAGVTSDPLDPGIQFQTGSYFVFGGQSKSGTIGYSVVTDSGSFLIDDADLRIVGAIPRGTGSMTGTEHLYFGGTTTDINSGSPISDVYPTSAFTHINFADFGGPNLSGFDVTTSIQVSADLATNGFVTLSAIEEHFSQIDNAPEPLEALLVGSGLVLLGWKRRKRTDR